MFPMTITINNDEELSRVLSALKPTLPAPATTKPEAKQEPQAPKAQQTAVASDAQPAVTPATQAPTAADSGNKTYTVDDAKQLTNKVVAAGKRDEMVALLAKFNVKVAAKLTEEQVGPFCQEAEALL